MEGETQTMECKTFTDTRQGRRDVAGWIFTGPDAHRYKKKCYHFHSQAASHFAPGTIVRGCPRHIEVKETRGDTVL